MNLKNHLITFLLILCSVYGFSQDNIGNDSFRIEELDCFWKEVSRTINDGDFDGYAATFHKKATYVSDINGKAYPIASALAGWKKDFVDTKAGLRKVIR